MEEEEEEEAAYTMSKCICQTPMILKVLKGTMSTYFYLFKKPKHFFQQLNSKKIMVQLCYLRLYLGTQTVSSRLLQQMARMDMD